MNLGIYLHIPFCTRRCDYCDFFVVVPGTGGEAAGDSDFADWIGRDLSQAFGRFSGAVAIDTLYFGGGTPSLIPVEEIARIIGHVARLAPIRADAEITLEANPESVTSDRLVGWLAAGISRLSLGVQSLSDVVLAPRGRLYTATEAMAAARLVRQAGFDSVSFDLIAGLPGETVGSFADGVRALAAIDPDHISIYLLELEESGKSTTLARSVREGRARPPHEDETLTMFTEGIGQLQASGLRRYEISNFARPGMESRHNMKYWTSHPWLGAGPSAHSYLEGRRFGRPDDMTRWREWVQQGGDPAESDYTLPDPVARAREALGLALRLTSGIDLQQFATQWGYDPRDDRAEAIEELRAEGLLAREPEILKLTENGMLLANEVLLRLT